MLSAKAQMNIWPELGYNSSLPRELGHVSSAGLVFLRHVVIYTSQFPPLGMGGPYDVSKVRITE